MLHSLPDDYDHDRDEQKLRATLARRFPTHIVTEIDADAGDVTTLEWHAPSRPIPMRLPASVEARWAARFDASIRERNPSYRLTFFDADEKRAERRILSEVDDMVLGVICRSLRVEPWEIEIECEVELGVLREVRVTRFPWTLDEETIAEGLTRAAEVLGDGTWEMCHKSWIARIGPPQ